MYQHRINSVAFILFAWGCSLSLLSEARGDEKTWVGKRIILTKGDVNFVETGKGDKPTVLVPLDEALYTVESEEGNRIKIRHRGVLGWIAKEDAVPLEKAIPYFTERILQIGKDAVAYGQRALARKE